MDHRPTITESEEMLLQKYFDGETSWLENLRVSYLLKNNPEAERYLQSLVELREKLTKIIPEREVDLWEAIDARIAQEKHSELFLGKRSYRNRINILDSLNDLVMSIPGGWVSAAGATAVIIAIIGLGVVRGMTTSNSPMEVADNSQPEYNIHQVNFEQDPNQRNLEVDWMRSDGRVKLVQEPNRKSVVIWVRNRNPDYMQLDGASNPSTSNPRQLRIIEERLPDTTAISANR